MNQALSSYQKNQISGMSQKDLIVMLYSGAIKFINQAKEHLTESSSEKYSDAIERAHRIVYHLYSTLDFEQGGEIASRLGALYTFIIGQLYSGQFNQKCGHTGGPGSDTEQPPGRLAGN